MDDVAKIARGLSEDEIARLLTGRPDWRDADWQDHCGNSECERCTGLIDTQIAPNALSDADKALREYLERQALKGPTDEPK